MEPGDVVSKSLAGIVLAAGAGRRFGSPKATVMFRGEHLVERAIRVVRTSGCDPCFVVLGAEADSIRSRADLRPARVVVTEAWPDGMSASLKAGLAAATATDAGAAVIVLVDQPLVGAQAIERLKAAWVKGAVVAVACYDGQPRNPALFDRSVWSEVSASSHDDVGARGWLQAHAELVTRVECSDVGDPADIDTAEDLERIEHSSG
jgi:nicotine blue oxidoreductase